jgi:hypothetical protein
VASDAGFVDQGYETKRDLPGGRPEAITGFHRRRGNVRLVASGMGEVDDENYLLIRVDGADVRIEAHFLDDARADASIESFAVATSGPKVP